MKQRTLSFLLALCLLAPAVPGASAGQDVPALAPAGVQSPAEPASRDGTGIPTPLEAYDIMIAMRDDYPEGMTWTDASSGTYRWQGGSGEQGEIAAQGTGCVNFAFRLSDAVFGSLPARMRRAGTFQFTDVKAGDILRVNNNSHSVIVLQTNDDTVVIAEGNYNKSIHWGRILTRDEVLAADHVLTRYPEGYVPPDDPTAEDIIGEGSFGDGLSWRLIRAGTLTISGNGAMPDFTFGNGDSGPISDRPWNAHMEQVQKIVIDSGVTSVGSNAFRNSPAYGVSLPASVSVIGNDAFRECANLTFASPDGVTAIGERAFQGCKNLKGVMLPASVIAVGAGAFYDCQELRSVKFLPGEQSVTMGDNIFTECWNLADVTLPPKMDKIGEGMFMGNIAGFTSLTIPEGVESIGASAFANCRNLQSIFIPNSVQSIGIAAFSNCGLTDIYFGGSEAEWAAVQKIGDTQTTMSKMTIHYDSVPPTSGDVDEPDPGPGTPDPGPDTPDPGPDTPEPGPGTPDPGPSTPEPGPDTPDPGPSKPDPEPSSSSSSSSSPDPKPSTQVSTTTSGDTASAQTIATPSVTSNGTTATCTVTTALANEIVKQAAANDSETIVIAPAISQDLPQVHVSIPAAALGEMGRKTDAGLTVSTPIANVTVPNGGLQGLSRTGGTVVIAAGRTDDFVELKITAGGQAVKRVSGGLTVTIPADNTTPGTVAVLVGADGSRRVIRKSVADGQAIAIPLDGPAKVAIVDNAKTFADVPSTNWAADAVAFASGHELFNGTSPDTFSPDAPMTRGMLVMALHNLENNPAQPLTGAFSDVKDGAWYAGAVAWAVEQGIVSGYGNGQFGADDNISREHMAVILWRYAGQPAVAGPELPFQDAGMAGSYALDALRWAVDSGIINGKGDGLLDPTGFASRAQVAQMLQNFLERD